MRIFRLQTDNNIGPISAGCQSINNKIEYELSYQYSDLLKDGTERKQHPDADTGTPLQKAYFDGLIYSGSPFIFGVSSIKDLYTWFCPAKIGMYEAKNIFIYEYIVPDEYVIMGTRQVVFDPKYAISSSKISHKKLRNRL